LRDYGGLVAEHLVGAIADFADGRRRIVTTGDGPVGVFSHEGTIYAYRNVCPHQGGPVCEGRLVARVEEEVGELGRLGPGRYSDEVTHLVCPWHGMEFDVATGQSWSDRRLRLRKHEVVEREGQVYVVA
jgi:nitrite reductase/ring-hydroxylating ferredoxin subunit